MTRCKKKTDHYLKTHFMQGRGLILALALICVLGFTNIYSSTHSSDADRILGNWYISSKLAKIEIYRSGTAYSGKISWLKKERDPHGRIKIDINNPNENLRSRTILGMEMLNNLKYSGKNEWAGGQVYDPETGKTYNCIMTLNQNGTLDVRGYIGYNWMGMGKTDRWTKAD